MTNEANPSCLSTLAAWPDRALSNMAAAAFSEHGFAWQLFNPWSERRPPAAWNVSWRCFSASRKFANDPIEILLAAAKRSTHGLKMLGRFTRRDLSGRNVGNTRNADS